MSDERLRLIDTRLSVGGHKFSFTPEAKSSIQAGQAIAENMNHPFFEPIHLIYGISITKPGSIAMMEFGFQPEILLHEMSQVMPISDHPSKLQIHPELVITFKLAKSTAAARRRSWIDQTDLLAVLSGRNNHVGVIFNSSDHLAINSGTLLNVARAMKFPYTKRVPFH